MITFSIIVPVYNRPSEVGELLESLSLQTCKDFEVVIVEDGSTITCDQIAKSYDSQLVIRYFVKPNSGRSHTRNYGMQRAEGKYLLFFDSDCLIPPGYFEQIQKDLKETHADCFGGAGPCACFVYSVAKSDQLFDDLFSYDRRNPW